MPVIKENFMRPLGVLSSVSGSRLCRRLVITALLLLWFTLSAEAVLAKADGVEGMKEDNSGDSTLRLEELLKEAEENNPRLNAARVEWERVKRTYSQEVSLDDPILTYTYPIEEIETRLGPQEHVVMLSQKLPFPGKLGIKGDIADKDAEIARLNYELARSGLFAKIKKTFYELYYVDKAIELAKENKTVLDYFKDVSKSNYGLNVSKLDELVRAQRLEANASEKLVVLRELRKSVASRLNALLDRAPQYPVGTPDEPMLEPIEYTEEELARLAAINYEGVKIAELMVDKSELKARLSRYKYRPDFRVGVNYSVIGDPPMPVEDAGRDAIGVVFGVNIPLWFGKNSAAIDEARLGREKSFIEKQAVINELRDEVKRAYLELKSAEKVVTLYKDSLISEAEESLEFAEARYKSGEEMLGRLLEAQSMVINFKLAHYRAVSDYLKAAAELERLTSGTLR